MSTRKAMATDTGQEDDSATDTDSDGEIIRSRQPSRILRNSKPSNIGPKPKAPAARKGRVGQVTLQHLITAGLVQPGKRVLTLEYHSRIFYADLRTNGVIAYEYNGSELTFESPSAFSITVKRHLNPTRKADDGWKAVKYNGKLIEVYKKQYQSCPTKHHQIGAAHPSTQTRQENHQVAEESRSAAPAAKRAKLEHNPAADWQETVPLNGSKATPVQTVSDSWQRASDPHGDRTQDARVTLTTKDLDKCESETLVAQPLRVEFSSAAAMMMEVHGYLGRGQAGGLLAGQWDPESRLLRIRQAHPARLKHHAHPSGIADMDLSSVKARIMQSNLSCVGCYQSSPPGSSHLSDQDREACRQHQASIGWSGGEEMPFIAATVSQCSGSQPEGSEMKLFQISGLSPSFQSSVKDSMGGEARGEARALRYTESSSIEDDVYTQQLRTSLFKETLALCTSSAGRDDLSHLASSRTAGHRLMQAVASRLPDHWLAVQKTSFLDAFREILHSYSTSGVNLMEADRDEEDVELSTSQATKSMSEEGLANKDANLKSDGESQLLGLRGWEVPTSNAQLGTETQPTARQNVDQGMLAQENGCLNALPEDSTEEDSVIHSGSATQLSSPINRAMFDSDNEPLKGLHVLDSPTRMAELHHPGLGPFH